MQRCRGLLNAGSSHERLLQARGDDLEHQWVRHGRHGRGRGADGDHESPATVSAEAFVDDTALEPQQPPCDARTEAQYAAAESKPLLKET